MIIGHRDLLDGALGTAPHPDHCLGDKRLDLADVAVTASSCSLREPSANMHRSSRERMPFSNSTMT